MQEEVSVVGQDGQMYRGRLTRRLPGLYSNQKVCMHVRTCVDIRLAWRQTLPQ